jgi:ankyrin repeat protein
MTAARTGMEGPVKALLEAGADIDGTLPNGQTALMWATAENNIEVARVLLDAGADFKTPLASGYTPFFFAVRGGYRELTQLFLERGADLHATMQPEQKGGRMPRSGTTALVLAIENAHFELALDLLDRGADPNDANVGRTPLHLLVRVRKPDRGEGAAGEPPPPVLGDVDSIDFARELVARGADVNARIETGDIKTDGNLTMRGATPFLLACDTADLGYMKFLVEMGADPFIPNADGTTPLMAAAGIGSTAPEEEAGTPEECLFAVEFLVSLGAGVNDVNDHGETAMHGAASKNAPELIRFLHEQGADIDIWNHKNQLGWTPLYIAEGYRPGNFKPSFETIDAVAEVMLANGVAYPDEPRPVHVNYSP